jgi:hypothetical protein
MWLKGKFLWPRLRFGRQKVWDPVRLGNAAWSTKEYLELTLIEAWENIRVRLAKGPSDPQSLAKLQGRAEMLYDLEAEIERSIQTGEAASSES